MNFVIGNFNFNESIQCDKFIYYRGTPLVNANKLIFYDGYLMDRKRDSFVDPSFCIGDLQNYSSGVYNVVEYNIEKNFLRFMNDKEGIIPLYFYNVEGTFLISNNVWDLVEILGEKIAIDYRSLLFQLAYHNDVNPSRTLFKGIERLSPGMCLEFDLAKSIFSSKNYWIFKYKPNDALSLDDVACQLNDDLEFLFKKMHDSNPGMTMGFGNSGGFDSRLIAHYASKEKMPVKSFVFCQEKPRLLKSTTAYLSEKIAKIYNIDNTIIESTTENLWESFLLDIRNNPFGSCEVFKNDLQGRVDYDYMVTGQPGALAYILPPDIAKSKNKSDLYFHADYFLGFAQHTLHPFKQLLTRSMSHLNINYNKKDGYLGINNNLLYPLLKGFKHSDLFSDIIETVDALAGDSNVESWIRIHDAVTQKYVYCGGYESINRLKRSYYLYSPFLYDMIGSMPFHFFEDRLILKHMFAKYNKKLSLIPGQNFQNANTGKTSLVKKIEMAYRGRGMNLDYLLKSKQYQSTIRIILHKKNEIFNEFVDVEQLMKSKILYGLVGVNVVKIKILLDIFQNKEFDIFRNPKYDISEWK